MRAVSFCFDDGFLASAGKVRALFEARGLSACFCVLARPDLADDPFIRAAPIADWGYWREAQAAGHEVAPHGYAHERLWALSEAAARDSLNRTFDAFAGQMPGFDPAGSVHHLAYLAAPAPLVDWIAERTLGVRLATGGDGLNPLGLSGPGARVDCVTFGDPGEAKLAARLDRFLGEEEGWLTLVLHGLDGEGYGTLPSAALARELDRLLAAGVAVEPPGRRLASAAL